MKKVLLASIMVGLILATVFHVGFSATAVNVQKEATKEEETTGTYKLRVFVCDEYWWPSPIGGIDFAKVVVTSEDNPYFKRVGWTIFSFCLFSIPNEYEYPTVNAYKSRYEQTQVLWINENEVDILMKYTGQNLNNQQQSSAYQQSNLQSQQSNLQQLTLLGFPSFS